MVIILDASFFFLLIFRKQLSNGSLVFSSIRHTRSEWPDEGYYQCLANVPSVGTLLSRKAKIQVACKSPDFRLHTVIIIIMLSIYCIPFFVFKLYLVLKKSHQTKMFSWEKRHCLCAASRPHLLPQFGGWKTASLSHLMPVECYFYLLVRYLKSKSNFSFCNCFSHSN